MDDKYLIYAEMIGGIALIAVIVYFLYEKMKKQTKQAGRNQTGGGQTENINVSLSALSVSLTANPSSGPAPLYVTYVANASGGSGQYEYQFAYSDNNNVIQETDWIDSNTFSYQYNNAGVYYASVKVKDTVTGETAESNEITVNATLQTFNVKFCAEGLEYGDQATIEIGGVGHVIKAGKCITINNLSEPTDWVAFSSNQGASPSPQSGTVSKSKTIYISYTYPNRPPSQVQITDFSASSTNITQGSTVNFDVSATGGSGSYYFTLYVDNNPVGNTVGPGNSAKLSYTFNEAGTYSVYATAVDANLGANYSATSQTITINVQAPAGTYTVTFIESGLPATNPVTRTPVTWSVTINGQTQSAPVGQNITFTGLSGTVNYTVQSPITVPVNRYHYEKYYANPSSGTATQGGTIPITYSTNATTNATTPSSSSSSSTTSLPTTTYSYTFKESGLPNDALWSVTLNGNSITAKAGEPITFNGLSGSNSWTVASSIVGSTIYYPSPSSGTVSQSGSITISFSSPSSPSTSSSTTTGKDVSNLSVCDPSIQNGDYAIVNNQTVTGYSGTFTIINASGLRYYASIYGECSATVSGFIKAHTYGNGRYWKTP